MIVSTYPHCTYSANSALVAGSNFWLVGLNYTDSAWAAQMVQPSAYPITISELQDYINSQIHSYWLWTVQDTMSPFVVLSENQINSISINIDWYEQYIEFTQSQCYDLPLYNSESSTEAVPFFNADDLQQVALIHIWASSIIIIFFTIYLVIFRISWKN